MKIPMIALVVLFGGWSFLGAQTTEVLMKQEPLAEGNDARFEELTEVHSMMVPFEGIMAAFTKKFPALADEVAEVQAIDEFHEEEVEAALVAKVVNGDDIGMVEGREGLGFGLEAEGE